MSTKPSLAQLQADRTRLDALYWERRPGWTRSGDILHKHAVARQRRNVDAAIERGEAKDGT